MKGILIGVVIVLIAVAGYLLLGGGSPDASPTPTALSTATPAATGSPSATKTPAVTGSPKVSPTASPKATATPTTGAVKTFNVIGTPFAFSLSEIKVKKGDTVKIVFTNQQGTHDWVIDEFNARTAVLQAGKTQTIQFVANKTGTFEYYCSVGTHRQMGMKGNLIVE